METPPPGNIAGALPSNGGADAGLSSLQHPTHAMPCCCAQTNKIIYFTVVLAPYIAASTSLALPCNLDGQPPPGHWNPVDTSSETSSHRPAPKFSAFKTDHVLLYHLLRTGSFLTAPELFPLTDPPQGQACCTPPGETGPSGRACPVETRRLHAVISDAHPAWENIATVSRKGREGAALAMKSNGHHAELGPIYLLADTVHFIA